MARMVFLVLCICASLSVASAKKSGSLTGRVVDARGNPLIGATIRIAGTSLRTLSKAPLGVFTIEGLRAGAHKVSIGGTGRQQYECEVRISSGARYDLGVLKLVAMGASERRVVASGERQERDGRITVERDHVSAKRTVQSMSAGISNAVTLQSMSVGRENGVSIRGGRATVTSIRVDGDDVGDPYLGGYGGVAKGEYPAVTVPAVEPLDVEKEYPDAKPVAEETVKVVEHQTQAQADTVAVPKPVDNVSGENYAKIYENEFLPAHVSPLSTFSIDVDRASYSNIRRFLTGGTMPPADAVRIEEMVNYFDYGYSDPDDEHPFRIATEMTDCPWDRSHRLVRIGLQGRHVATSLMPPSNLTFLIDVSGSMGSSDKLPLLQRSLRVLVERLRPEDNVAIVVYAGAAGAVLPMTSGAKKAEIIAAINNLQSGGSTAGGEGINLAYKIARENFLKDGNNRVILATDGDFNLGVSSEADLVSLIEERRKDRIYLTVLGFGTGNYQDAKMEQLADKGNGNYAYIDNISEAEKVLGNEMGATLLTIAKDVKLQVVFSPERVESYRLIGYENRMLATDDFDNDLKDAGELGAGHTVTALYEIVPRGAESASLDGWVGRKDTLDMPGDWKAGEMMRVRLRYKLPESDVSTLIEGPVIDRGVGIERASEDFRFQAAVAQFGMLLRGSRHKGSSSYDGVLRLANAAKGIDVEGYRAEFITLVEAARNMPVTASR
jgi:Ca-activated chloride channel homolog